MTRLWPEPGPDHPALGEEQVVGLVARLAAQTHPPGFTGIGDDAAVIPGPGPWAVTTDLMIEGVHFRRDWAGPAQVGWRVMAANLSDLAAMGARPAYAFLSLALNQAPTRAVVEGLVGGMLELARPHGLILAGGDTCRGPALTLNLCLMGQAPAGGALLRSGARPGDLVVVSGPLGGSAAGLAWLAAGRDPAEPRMARLLELFHRPRPRVAGGMALAAAGGVTAMMDISDGLATDLARLARASGVGIALDQDLLPLHPDLAWAAERLGIDPLTWALTGGEDFELAYTCPPERLISLTQALAKSEDGLQATVVGRVTPTPGVWLEGPQGRREIGFTGFDHFSPVVLEAPS